MRVISSSTMELDPYRAGVELADAMSAISPELIFLFGSADYVGSDELPQAFFDVLGRDDLVLIGCTGEGFLETNRVADVGACAMGFHFGGKVKLALEWVASADGDSGAATRTCLDGVQRKLGRDPELCFVVADFRCDGTAIEEALQLRQIRAVGGLAGDNMLEMNRCAVFANQRSMERGMAILGMTGAINFDIHLAHHMQSVGATGTITQAQGTRLIQIDQKSAMEFMETAVGRPVSRVDQGIVTFNVLNKEIPAKRYLRSIVTDSQGPDGSCSLFGSIREGSLVEVCIANPEQIIREVHRVADSLQHDKFEPQAAIVISCAGRKHLLGNRIEHEVHAFRDRMKNNLQVCGFPSFGEFSPVPVNGDYSETFFHNMTAVILLLGA